MLRSQVQNLAQQEINIVQFTPLKGWHTRSPYSAHSDHKHKAVYLNQGFVDVLLQSQKFMDENTIYSETKSATTKSIMIQMKFDR